MDFLSFLIVPFWFLLCIISFGFFVASFFNTKDGYFLHILNPLSIFQASLFNEVGKKYRKGVFYSVLLFVILGVAWLLVTGAQI